MKKKKRLLSLCLGLVLVLGVSACEDLNDILGDQGSDEPDIGTELEEGDGDNNKGNDDTSESNISYTYSVLITNADELTPLVVEGDTVTAKVSLITTTHNRVTDEVNSSTVDATADDVVLESSTPGVLEINGLTINPIGAGTTTLTAYWSEHEATSSGVEITISEPDSYTYVLTINNKESYTDLTTESNLEDVSITLTTYKNGVVEGTPETGSGETVSLVSSSEDVISVTPGSLSLTVVGAGDTIITAYWIGHEGEAYDTIAITVSEPTSGGGEGGENPGGGDEPGGSGENPGGDEGGDEGGGSGEGGGTGGTGGDDDEPSGGEPETVYISTLTFDQATYELDLETNTTASFSVTALGPDGATPSAPTAYSVEIVDTNVAAIEEGVIVAKEVGTTTIKAYSTDNPGSPVYGCASITVTLGYEPVTSFSVSPETIELNVGSSVTLGYGENDDYKVSVTPEAATKTSFTLSGTTDEYLTISEKGTDNTYTITAPSDVSGAGAAIRTYTLTITSDDPNSTATKDISVVISEIPEVAHPVTSITLSGDVTVGEGSYTKTIGHTGSFTIGPTGSGANVIASVNEGAYDTSINVSSDDNSYISISGPDENGIYTVSVVEDIADTELTASITIASAANPSVSTTLALTISRAEAYAYAVTVNPSEVTMLTSSTLIIGNDATYSNLTVSVTNQYGEEVNDATWTAELTQTSSEGVITSISYDANTITINTGTVTGTGVITISVTGTDLTATIAVTVNQQYYDIDTITYSGGDVSLTYNLGTEPVGSSTTISGENVTYSSTKGPVAEGTEADFALYSEDTDHISINEKSITAVAPTEDPVTVYIYLVSDPSVYTTISVTVSDITDYGVTSLSVTSTVTEIGAGETKTLEELGVVVTINPSYATDKSYTVESNSDDILAVTGTYSEGYSLTASSNLREDVNVVLTFTSTDNSSATDTLTITVTNDYVAVTSVTLDASTLSLTYGGDVGNTATITASVNPSNATDAGVITWNSSNPSAVTISGDGAEVTLTAVGAGTSYITATCGGVSSTACTVTVTEVFRSYTVVISLKDSSHNDFEAPYGDYGVYLASEYDGGGNNVWGSYHKMTYDTTSKTYSYTFDTLPEAGSYYTYICAGDENGYSYSHEFGDFYITVSGSETGAYKADTVELTTEYENWESIFAVGEDESFYIVFIDNSKATNNFGTLYITSGDACFSGSTYCTAKTTTTSYSELVWYSEVGTLGSGSVAWFTLCNATDTSSQSANKWMQCGEITIPDNTNGIPVYVGVGWFNGWTGTYNASENGTGWQYMSSSQTIEQFIASLPDYTSEWA